MFNKYPKLNIQTTGINPQTCVYTIHDRTCCLRICNGSKELNAERTLLFNSSFVEMFEKFS